MTVAIIALLAPAVAIAGKGGNCSASACKVYVEPDVPNAGGQHAQEQQSHSTGSKGGKTHVPNNVSRMLALAGKDKAALAQLLKDSHLGGLRAGTGSIIAPSALGAAFDLGSGPTALLAILLGSALALAVYNGIRGWRGRRTSA